MKIAMAWTEASRRLTLRLVPRSRMLPPARRPIEVRVAGRQAVKHIVFEGKPVAVDLGAG